MTPAEITALVRRIEVRNWPWQIMVGTSPHAPGAVFITDRALDRDTGDLHTFGDLDDPTPPENASKDEVVVWIFKRLVQHVVHELRESFYVGGVRVFDPHPSEVREMNRPYTLDNERERLRLLADKHLSPPMKARLETLQAERRHHVAVFPESEQRAEEVRLISEAQR